MHLSTRSRIALGFFVSIASAHLASGQVLTPGGTIQGPSSNGVPASGATGPLGQIRSGLFGQFAPNDNWAALGESPFGVGGVLPYGLRLQKSSQFGLFNQVTNPFTGAEDLVVGWGQNPNSLLRLRFINDQFNNTFTDVLKLQGGTLAPAAEITAAALSGSETPLSIGVSDAPGNSLTVSNATGGAGQFIPQITATRTGDVRESLFITGVVDPGNDVFDQFGIARPVVTILGRRSNGTALTTRPIFAVKNQGNATLGNSIFEVRPNGQVVASGTITGSGSLISSDERFKSDIKPLENGLALIRQLNGRTYSFKKEEKFAERAFPQGRMDGFIAQEMQKVMPEAVVKQPDGYYAVNYDAVIPVLVEAVKQLDAKQTETAQLQQQLVDMKSQLAELRTMVEKSTGKGSTPIKASGTDLSQASLGQNAPNPFDQRTRIEYSLPVEVKSVTLNVMDMQGRLVKVVSGLRGGRQVVELEASSLPAGNYIYTLTADGQEVASKRMVLTR